MKYLMFFLTLLLAACGGSGSSDSTQIGHPADTVAINGNTTLNVFSNGTINYKHWNQTDGLTSGTLRADVSSGADNTKVLAFGVLGGPFSGISATPQSVSGGGLDALWSGLVPEGEQFNGQAANFLADGNFLAICHTSSPTLQVLASTNLRELTSVDIKAELQGQFLYERDYCGGNVMGTFTVDQNGNLIHSIAGVDTIFTPSQLDSALTTSLLYNNIFYSMRVVSYTKNGSTMYFIIYHEGPNATRKTTMAWNK